MLCFILSACIFCVWVPVSVHVFMNWVYAIRVIYLCIFAYEFVCGRLNLEKEGDDVVDRTWSHHAFCHVFKILWIYFYLLVKVQRYIFSATALSCDCLNDDLSKVNNLCHK